MDNTWKNSERIKRRNITFFLSHSNRFIRFFFLIASKVLFLRVPSEIFRFYLRITLSNGHIIRLKYIFVKQIIFPDITFLINYFYMKWHYWKILYTVLDLDIHLLRTISLILHTISRYFEKPSTSGLEMSIVYFLV